MDRPHRLRLLGGFRLTSAEGETIAIPRRKGSALLAYLGVTIGSENARDKLASLLWGQSKQSLARQSLRQLLRTLRQDLANKSARILRLNGQMVSLDSDYVQVDAPEFEALTAQGDRESLTKAAGLYRGEFLAGLSTDAPDFEDWLDQSRSRFRDLALQALVRLSVQQYAAKDVELAADTANQALRFDPYREDIHRHLMRMYAERGMRAAALAQYRECAAILRRELDVAPDDETLHLYNEILARAQAPRAQDAEPPVPHSGAAGVRQDEAVRLVGFDRERALLRRYFDDAPREGARLVLISADGGAGKSALLEQLRGDLDQDAAAVLIARAYPAERSMSFAFWKDFLNKQTLDLAGHRELESSLTRRLAFLRKILGAFARPHHAGADYPWHAFDAMVDLIRQRGRDAPLVLAIEDVHCTDDASLCLLFYLVRNLRDTSVLFIATARPEELAARRDLTGMLRDLDGDGLLHRVALRPLVREEVEVLVRSLRQKSHAAMVSRAHLREICVLSDGNPGLVVETALAVGGEHTAAGTPPDLPAGLYSELVTRLAGLDDTVRLLAATASVIGLRIEFPVLARAAGVDETTALRGVERLIATGILTSTDERLTFARGRFRVAQYRSLLPARRRQLHLAVARVMAAAPPDDPTVHFAALAHHYKAAGRLLDALHNDTQLAKIEMRRGEYAAAKSTFQRVLRALPAATETATEVRLEIEARLGLAEIEEAAGNIGAALAHLRTPIVATAEMPTAALRMRYFSALGRLNGILGNDEIALERIRRAAGTARSDENDLWQPCDRLLEFFHVVGGAAQASIDRLERARDTARRRGLRVDEVALCATLGLLRALSGTPDAASAEAQAAVDGAIRLGESRLLAVGLHVRGLVRTWGGDVSGALQAFTDAIEMASVCGDLPRLYTAYGYRGHALAAAGRYAEANADLDTALRMAEELDLGFSRPLFQAWKAGVLAKMGNPDLALPAAHAALRRATAANRPWAYSVALRVRACALAHPSVRDFAGAERAVRAALAEQRSMGLEIEAAESLVAYARILHAAGETKRSVRLVRQAQKALRRMKTMLNQEAVQGLTKALCTPCRVGS